MSYQLYKTVAFGASKAGLTTVGYTLYNTVGDAVGGRVTSGVQDLGGGQYGATVTFPDGFSGRITWDTGEADVALATGSVNTADAQDDRDELRKLDSLTCKVDSLRRAAEAVPGGIFNQPGVAAAGVVRAEMPQMDDCNVLTRLKAFVVDQGVCAVLEHVFRDRRGNPVDLSAWLTDCQAVSASLSASSSGSGSSSSSSSCSTAGTPAGVVKLRIKEWLGAGTSPERNPFWTAYGEAYDATAGVVRVRLPAEAVEQAGIYELNWAVVNETGHALLIDRAIMSVDKSLFARDPAIVTRNLGPPTLQEIRMRLMDSSRTENLLLDDVEFKDEQILQAVAEPVRLWNETPPPIRTFTTRDFPFRGAWFQGIIGQLHLTAATHYRRNLLRQTVGGGADKDKEREYMAEGQRLWAEYVAWVKDKKVEINLRLFSGRVDSMYSNLLGGR